MSKLRNIRLFDSTDNPIAFDAGRLPAKAYLYDANGSPVTLDTGKLLAKSFLYDANGNPVNLENNKVPTVVQFSDSPSLDAFERLRTSTPQTVFDNIFQYDLRPWRFSNNLVGTGSITHVANEAEAQLSTGGTASGAKAILQTKRYIRYEPGKSQLVLLTANLGLPKAAVRQRIGLFDNDNGLYFEQTETAKAVAIRSKTSGIVVENKVAQVSWNLDTLDGNGPSGISIDLSKTQIFVIDYQWLGVGRVRFGFNINGRVIYCHQFVHANNEATVYMTRPHLPVRAEIENTAVAASVTTMDQYCMAVMSEGGITEQPGDQWAIGRGTTRLGVTIRRPVLSIRPGPLFNSIVNRGHLTLGLLELNADTNDCLFELVIGGTLTGASWTAVNATYSITEYDTAATAITGGQVRSRGWAFAGKGSTVSNTSSNQFAIPIEAFNDFAGTSPDIISLVCTAFTGTSNILANLHWTEQR